jgi:hypothetical protein
MSQDNQTRQDGTKMNSGHAGILNEKRRKIPNPEYV